jgi:spermidine synthase
MLNEVPPKHLLILGGGDGLAVRECLKYPSVESICLVDLDPAMTQLSDHFEPLKRLNHAAFEDPRVTVVNADAFIWIGEKGQRYDTVIIDFPDPGNYSIGKLYTSRFYRLLKERLEPHARVTIQCTSPLVAPKSYWCILKTLKSSGFDVRPYQATVPSFGVWGYALASPTKLSDQPLKLNPAAANLRFLTDEGLIDLFQMPADIRPVEVEINRLDNQVLVRYYDEEWNELD